MEAALEAVEKAEDDLLYAIGEMSRWLEAGYGIPAADLWSDGGVRNVRKKKWKAQRDEVQVMVSHGAANVKSELKRHGLAGAGAQARFEVSPGDVFQIEGQAQARTDVGESHKAVLRPNGSISLHQRGLVFPTFSPDPLEYR